MKVVGVVESFDERRGDGVVRSEADESLYFHCVAVADGTRSIVVGTRVVAWRHVGQRGHDEVVAVAPRDVGER